MRGFLLRILCWTFLPVFMAGCDDSTKVEGVSMSQDMLGLRIGESVQIEVIVSPLSASAYNTVKWDSDDPSVAVVDAKGVITGVYVGECTVTASAGGKSAKCSVRVGTTYLQPEFMRCCAVGGGDDNGSGTNHVALFLMGEGMTFDTAVMRPEGDGEYLVLDVESPWGEAGVAEGEYGVSDVPQAYSCRPGSVRRNGEEVVMSGSCLVTEEDTLPVKGGAFVIGADSVRGGLDCEGNEILELRFAGKVRYYDLVSAGEKAERFSYDEVEMTANGKTDDFRYYMTSVALRSEDGSEMRMNAVSPLSMPDDVPPGRYTVSGEAEPFHIVSCAADESNGAVYVDASGRRRVLASGLLEVSYEGEEMVCRGSFQDEEGRTVVCMRRES